MLLRQISEMPADAQANPATIENGDVVLAHGEVTGHHHGVPMRHAGEFATGGGARILMVKKPTALVHQEHSAIPLKPGAFEIIRQCEYSPEAIRNVAD